MQSLERELQKPDWRQWIPVYGIHRMKKDDEVGKPIVGGGPESYQHIIITGYSAAILALPVVSGAVILMDYLSK